MANAEMLQDLQRMGKDVAEYQILNKAAITIHHDKMIEERLQNNFKTIRRMDIRSKLEKY